MVKNIYFPGLNGLRAIAAITVVIWHCTQQLGGFNLDPYYLSKYQNGYRTGHFMSQYAVTIFFVLSGFLITYLLQIEKDREGIDIKKFYTRRILRIWPLYYTFLIVCLIIILVLKIAYINTASLFLYLFFAANVPLAFHIPIPLIYHYWSIGIEEQFYLFWPWVNKKSKFIVRLTTTLVAILITIKLTVHFCLPNTSWDELVLYGRFQCMMIGGIGAVLYKQKQKLFLYVLDNRISQIIAWVILFMAANNRFHIATIIDDELFSIVALTLIIGQINIKNRIINLDTKVFNFLGRISYGIYVIHMIIIFVLVKLYSGVQIQTEYKYPIVYISVIGATIIVSYLSYTFLETPFLKLKKRFAVVHSSASAKQQSTRTNIYNIFNHINPLKTKKHGRSRIIITRIYQTADKCNRQSYRR